MGYAESTVLVTGHAKPMKDDAINNVYQVLSLSLIIDAKTDCIENVSCTMVMRDSENFIRDMMVGRNILTDMAELRQSIVTRFLSLAQKPLAVALKDVQNRYLMAFPEKQVKKD